MVTTTLRRIVYPCWRPTIEDEDQDWSSRGGDPNGRVDGLLWYKDLGHHVNGEFSMAVIQANSVLEDQSQLESGSMSSVETGPQGTFVGVYDGHAGPEAARFICDHLFNNIKSMFSGFAISFIKSEFPSFLVCHLLFYFASCRKKLTLTALYAIYTSLQVVA